MRIVIKIGTSTLTYKTGAMNIRRVEKLCRVISDLKNSGNEIIIVSSGAVAMGVGKLALNERPKDVPTKQAAAAIGQCELMYIYDELFSKYHHTVAQILLTAEDIKNERQRNNFQNTMNRLMELGAIPVLNENDSVATDEIVIGDNDTLAANIATEISADLLIILTDTKGLYTSDPRQDTNAELISEVRVIDESIISLAKGKGSELATGGMVTKLKAAQIATEAGIDMVIADGNDPDILYDIYEGKQVGTRFYAGEK